MGQLRCPPRRAGEVGLKILGLDPGLGTTGWGLIEAEGNRLAHVANGQIKTDTRSALPRRLAALADQLEALIGDHGPAAAAVVEVGEYSPTLVKKAVVGTGGAEKAQVHAMVSRLLPSARIVGPDAADALAVAITHAHHLASRRRMP